MQLKASGMPARSWALVLSLASLAGAFWSAWSELPALSAPLEIAAVPLGLALAALFPNELTLGPIDKADKRGSLCLGLTAAMMGLAIGAWREFGELVFDQVVGWCAVVALIVGFALALLAARLDKKQMADTLMLVLAGVTGALWAAGLLLEVNGHLPERGFIQTPAEVVDKQVWRGGRGSTSYRLSLRTNPQAPAGIMTVGRPIFDRASIGARLCVIRTSGTLGLRWWKVDECRKSGR